MRLPAPLISIWRKIMFWRFMRATSILASFSWISWNSPIGRPNWTRVRAYSTQRSRHWLTMPSAIAGTPARSCEKVCLAPARAGAPGRRLHAAEGVRARARLGDRPGADRLERGEGQRPALLLPGGPARHDRAGRQPDAHAERGHHAGAVAAELDDGDQLHARGVGRLGARLRERRARRRGLLAQDLPLDAGARHLIDAEGGHHLAEHRVGRGVAMLELAQVRLDLGLHEAAKRLADQLVLLAPLDHEDLPRTARVFRSMRSRLFSMRTVVSRRRSNHWSAVDSSLGRSSCPGAATSR